MVERGDGWARLLARALWRAPFRSTPPRRPSVGAGESVVRRGLRRAGEDQHTPGPTPHGASEPPGECPGCENRRMTDPAATQPLAVIALGGNALLRRGEPATAANQLRAARDAATVLGPVSQTARLVITNGNGQRRSACSLSGRTPTDGVPYPLDVLDAESGGQIGYVVELELDNAIDHRDTVTVITSVLTTGTPPPPGPRLRAAGGRAAGPTCSCWRPTSTPSTPVGVRPPSARSIAPLPRGCARRRSRVARWGRRSRPVCRFVEATGDAPRSRRARGDPRADRRDGGYAGRRPVAGRRVRRLNGIPQLSRRAPADERPSMAPAELRSLERLRPCGWAGTAGRGLDTNDGSIRNRPGP